MFFQFSLFIVVVTEKNKKQKRNYSHLFHLSRHCVRTVWNAHQELRQYFGKPKTSFLPCGQTQHTYYCFPLWFSGPLLAPVFYFSPIGVSLRTWRSLIMCCTYIRQRIVCLFIPHPLLSSLNLWPCINIALRQQVGVFVVCDTSYLWGEINKQEHVRDKSTCPCGLRQKCWLRKTLTV